MALTDLTDDILLHIISMFLDLSDTFSLLSTCKSLHSLSAYKHLWLIALTHESKHRALSCPISFNLYTSTTSQLQEIALNTQKLKANWGSASPRSTGPLLQYKYAEESELDGTGGEILTVIPNTRIAVIFCAGNILCRDLRRLSQPLSTNSIFIGGYYSWYTYEYRPGELYVGLITSQSEDIRLSMVRIKFSQYNCSPPELLWKTALTVECKSLFILEDTVGFISYYYLSTMYLKLIDLHDSARSKAIVLELPDGNFSFADYKSCWVHNGHLYLHLQITSSNHEIYRIEFDRSLCSRSANEEITEKAKMILVMHDKWTLDNHRYPSSWTPWLKMSMRGLQTAQVLSTPDDSVAKPKLTRLTFWPLSYGEKEIYSDSETKLKRSQLEIPGEITYFDHDESGYLTFRSYSGTYAVMIIATPQRWPSSTANLSLYLFHFDSETGTIPYRKLNVPERICLEDIFSISIEERSGMVYLVDVRGWLFGLQFGFMDKEGERDVREAMECLSVDSGHVGMRRVEVTSGN